jgi:hypothetical protein
MLHFISDRERKNSIGLSLGRALFRGVVRWATFGALGALLSIVLMALGTEQQLPWFYAAWFVTAVASMALLGALYTICTSGLSWLESKTPRVKST